MPERFSRTSVELDIEPATKAAPEKPDADTPFQILIVGDFSGRANRGLRAALSRLPVPAHIPPMQYCTDNAAMIAGLGHLAFQSKTFAPLDLDAITYSQFADHL